ncbi:hypothetical protein HS088_TW22G00145 [Tripterygium wilfordii]|uniref:Large ribosomal subunit protein uL30m n=1 Tax=Tripterygium wilfordii TaxID=458696 RepID=A0A7J7BXW8_TRIWF|nr:hypothetical protein HS088_TW22G00145 [Tripterygium wilfordii]
MNSLRVCFLSVENRLLAALGNSETPYAYFGGIASSCNRTVMRWNTPTVRGMLRQVKRLVVIETGEMYKARKQVKANHGVPHTPLLINHLPGPASGSS